MCLQEIFKNYASGDAIWHILGATETTKKRCVILLSVFVPFLSKYGSIYKICCAIIVLTNMFNFVVEFSYHYKYLYYTRFKT